VRFTTGAAAWIAIGGAAAFLFYSERQLAAGRAGMRTFDLRAREASDALSDLRAAEQAYVAGGQGLAYWMPKVASITESVTGTLASLRPLAATTDGRSALDAASASITEFGAIDKRARDYIKSDQALMAGDVIFTEASQAAVTTARHVEAARVAERQGVDAAEAGARKVEAAVLAGAAGIAALAILGLAPKPRAPEEAAAADPVEASSTDVLMLRPARPEPQPPFASARAVSPILKSAADLCTDFARVNSVADLAGLLGRAAHMMDASGLIVWVGSTSGADLRPVLAHGYSNQALARMPAVARSADNAAAAAYRTGALQIVLSRPGGTTPGAIVAPLLGPDGCIGALSAEISSGGEASDAVQALAALFAAQITSVIVAPQEAAQARVAASS